MSFAEWQDWQAFVMKRGSLNVGMRVEAGAALVAWTLARIHGSKADIGSFMPHADKPEPEQITVQDVFAMLKAKARH